jgi:hypothetical protein
VLKPVILRSPRDPGGILISAGAAIGSARTASAMPQRRPSSANTKSLLSEADISLLGSCKHLTASSVVHTGVGLQYPLASTRSGSFQTSGRGRAGSVRPHNGHGAAPCLALCGLVACERKLGLPNDYLRPIKRAGTRTSRHGWFDLDQPHRGSADQNRPSPAHSTE